VKESCHNIWGKLKILPDQALATVWV